MSCVLFEGGDMGESREREGKGMQERKGARPKGYYINPVLVSVTLNLSRSAEAVRSVTKGQVREVFR